MEKALSLLGRLAWIDLATHDLKLSAICKAMVQLLISIMKQQVDILSTKNLLETHFMADVMLDCSSNGLLGTLHRGNIRQYIRSKCFLGIAYPTCI